MKTLAEKILKGVVDHPTEFARYNDLFDCCRTLGGEDKVAHEYNHRLRDMVAHRIRGLVESHAWGKLEDYDNLLFRSLIFGAPYYFDDYLQAVEFGKPLDKKFYQPRRHYLKRYVDAYQEILDGKLDFLSISMPKRSGKALTLDTPILTPQGWLEMGDVHVGDRVMGPDGCPTRVTHVFPQGKVPIYKVTFSDGAVVRTCGDHLWRVRWHDLRGSNGKYVERTLSTRNMLEEGLTAGNTAKSRHNVFSIPLVKPMEFPKQALPLSPYVLGALIGDGYLSSSISITNTDSEVIEKIRAELPEGDMIYCQSAEKNRWVIKHRERRVDLWGHPLKCDTAQILNVLGLLGKRSWNKFIPPLYLWSDSHDRWELLRGLLDTDGTSNNRQIEYSTTSPILREQVMFLVRSLGGKCRSTERMGRYRKDGKVVETRLSYRVFIQFPAGVRPFYVTHKAIYSPARKTLYRYVESIEPDGEDYAQCICVDNEDHLFVCSDHFVATHNSQLGINFTTMLSGKFPDKSTLMEGTGDDLVKSFYLGCLEYIMLPTDYHYYDIFPDAKLVQTNADTKILNLNHKSRFPTIMCRSIDARQVGLSEATNLLYLDDCVEGREEAKNRQRLDDKWEVISGDVLGRAIEGTPLVICGTRYSIYDPIGRLQEEMKKQGKRMRIMETPALDPVSDESNFEYVREGKRVFTTRFFREQREMLSAEQWESEFQQQPFEAKGLLYPVDKLNYYYELPPDRDPDTVIAVCDTADKGSDSTSLPVAAVYGEDVFIVDVVFNDAPPDVTKPECARCLVENKVVQCTFESNNAGEYFAKDVNELVKQMGGQCSIRTKRTISNKQTRIEFSSDYILKHFYFKDPSTYARNSQYAFFMKELTTYTRSGKVPHDDAPDSLSLLENELRRMSTGKVEVFDRPW